MVFTVKVVEEEIAAWNGNQKRKRKCYALIMGFRQK
jgi:hypothetical protein